MHLVPLDLVSDELQCLSPLQYFTLAALVFHLGGTLYAHVCTIGRG